MSGAACFTGLAVAEGAAAGRLYLAGAVPVGDATPEQVAAAFAAVAEDRAALADRLRAAGRSDEADIVGVAALIAGDSVLVGPAVAAVRSGLDAASAVMRAAEAHAAIIEAAGSPELAERAGDVRQVGHAVLERLAGGAAGRPDGEFILVRREVAAADLIELAEHGLVGAVSVAGGASSHAAIIARGLGVPMITGVDAAVLAAQAGRPALLDADAGQLIIDPPAEAAAAVALRDRQGAVPRAVPGPARTADGRLITVLCNVASAAETRRGLAGGAAGVGLLRTEMPFTGALGWPSLAEHRAQLSPILSLLAGLPATVRLLDFSGDKIPPFLRSGGQARASSAAASGTAGLGALLAHPAALSDQLAATLAAGQDSDLAILVPMVSSLDEIRVVRDALAAAAARLGVRPPRLGIMVELLDTAADAEKFAAEADFFSIGTNDLTSQVLGLDRLDLTARPALAAHPRVLELIGHVAETARAAGIAASVCGDAAADPVVLPLLIGLGVETLSVPAAQVDRVRAWIQGLDAGECAALAATAVTAATADDVAELVRRARLS